MAYRLLGGGSSLTALTSDVNSNILEMMREQTSNKRSNKVVASGTVTGVATVSATTTIDITHNLTYIPQVEIWMLTSASKYRPLPAVYDVTLGAGITFASLFDYEVDLTKVRIQMTLGSSSTYAGTRTFKYILYKNTAN